MKNFNWTNEHHDHNSCSILGNHLTMLSVLICIIGGGFLSSAIFAVLGAAMADVPMFLMMLLWIVCSFLLGFLFE